jgi:hypothetical protein
MTWLRQAAERDADHRKTDEGGGGSAIAKSHTMRRKRSIPANVRSRIQMSGFYESKFQIRPWCEKTVLRSDTKIVLQHIAISPRRWIASLLLPRSQ